MSNILAGMGRTKRYPEARRAARDRWVTDGRKEYALLAQCNRSAQGFGLVSNNQGDYGAYWSPRAFREP